MYVDIAKLIYQKSEVTEQERFLGKVCVLSLGYGAYPKRLAIELGSMDFFNLTERAYNLFHSKFFPKVRPYWAQLAKKVAKDGVLRLPNRSIRFFKAPELQG